MKNKLLKTIIMLSKCFLYGLVLQTLLLNLVLALNANGQYKNIEEVRVTLSAEQLSLNQFFREVQRQTPFKFSYEYRDVDRQQSVTFVKKEGPVIDFLREAAQQSQLSFRQVNHGIDVLKRKDSEVEVMTATYAVTVNGTVVDETGDPLPGATVTVEGSLSGTVTDIDGNYSIDVAEGAVLVVSFIGYKTMRINVSNQSRINIAMELDESSLEEVVVIGYGTQKKSDLTGSVASLSGKDLNSQPITSLEQGLQGRIAGVQVTNNSSAPGGGMSIRIRGTTSILNGSEPLYVIDGFPITGQSQFSTAVGRGRDDYTVNQNPLAALNPQDIESIEVLKDASAAAIYGVRGANGVIIVTTKRGSKGAAKVSYSGYMGVQSISKKADVMDAEEYQGFYNNLYEIRGLSAPFTGSPANEVDWQDEIFRDALIQNHQLDVSGGTDQVQYLVSGSFFDQEGVVKGSGFDRYSLRVNLDINASKKLKFGNSLNISRSTNNAAATEGESKNGITSAALMMSPILSIFQPDGTYSSNRFVDVPDADGVFNPIAFINETSDENVTTRVLGNVFGEYSITNDLKFRVSVGADIENRERHVYQSSKFNNENPLNTADVSSINRTSLLNENTINYTKSIGHHNIAMLGGFTAQKEREEFIAISAAGFATDATGAYNLSAGSVVPSVNSRFAEFSILSFIGRINYSYNDRYLLTLTARRDGSSKFAAGNQWATFPSIAGAWKISNEKFMAGAKSDIKLRVGYGQTGNQELAPYGSLPLLQSSNYNFGNGINVNGFSPFRVAVPDLTWEITSQINFGMDASFLDSRLNLSLDFYDKKTKNLLLEVVLPETSGLTQPSVQNLGQMDNVGWEISADGVVLEKKDFRWNIGFNLSTNRNEIISLGNPDQVGDLAFLAVQPTFNGGGARSYIQVGHPIGAFFGYEYDGLYKNQAEADAGQTIQPGVVPGMPRFVDINGDDVLDDLDRTVIGNPFPDLLYGFSSGIAFKAFQLRFFFQGQKGGQVYNLMRRVAAEPIRGQNILRELNDNWTPSNTDAVWPILGDFPPVGGAGNLGESKFFLEDASYLRMREITLTYNLPQDLLGLMSGSVYVTGQNLFTITDYKGYNPDVNGRANVRGSFGYDVSSYPLAKTILLGINLNF